MSSDTPISCRVRPAPARDIDEMEELWRAVTSRTSSDATIRACIARLERCGVLERQLNARLTRKLLDPRPDS
jgi:hypothetical protein